MSKQKKCIFVENRDCPFKTPQVPFETCQVCIEAWKTETAIRKKQIGSHVPNGVTQRNSVAVRKNNGLTQLNEQLKEIDERLRKDEIDPMEYIRLRREHINNLIEENTDLKTEEPEETKALPRLVRVAVITKSLFRKQILTYPEDWELPKEVSGKVIDMIFNMTKEKDASDIKLRSGGYKIACIAAEKNQLALLILEADEEFESYQDEMQRINLLLRTEKNWQDALKKLE